MITTVITGRNTAKEARMDCPGAPLPEFSLIQVQPWVDPLVEAYGFGPQSAYVEHCLLPVVGPTAAWLYRRLGPP